MESSADSTHVKDRVEEEVENIDRDELQMVIIGRALGEPTLHGARTGNVKLW